MMHPGTLRYVPGFAHCRGGQAKPMPASARYAP